MIKLGFRARRDQCDPEARVVLPGPVLVGALAESDASEVSAVAAETVSRASAWRKKRGEVRQEVLVDSAVVELRCPVDVGGS